MNFSGFVDTHCHVLPAMDDGPNSWHDALAMAKLAVEDGIHTVIATPHQLGSFCHNLAHHIRNRTEQFQLFLDHHQVPLTVYPGADVRIEADLIRRIQSEEIVTLADQHRHLLLELPHDVYFPLQPLLDQLQTLGITGILSHPERNQGLLAQPHLLGPLVDYGCLMQVTAASFIGTFGLACQQLAEHMLSEDLVHLVATDAHGPRARRPRLAAAAQRIAELTDAQTAQELTSGHPARILRGESIPTSRRPRTRRTQHWMRRCLT